MAAMSGLGRAAALLWLVVASAGCVSGGGRRDAGPGDGVDAGGGTGMDAGGPTSCSTNAECDDATPCTLDECVVGNVCQHTPLHSSCPSGQMCVPSRGCVEPSGDCASDADCDDGRRCNGEETCVVARGMCLPGTPIDCNDNNECTLDRCSETGGMCQYELAPGCDGGSTPSDGGAPCPPFDPGSDFAGTFFMLPSQSCGAGTGMYSVSRLVFSVTGGVLTVQAGPFTLSQSPAPTGASFDVTGSDSCATVRIQGMFTCRDEFMGMWTANHGATCAACGTSNRSITGVR